MSKHKCTRNKLLSHSNYNIIKFINYKTKSGRIRKKTNDILVCNDALEEEIYYRNNLEMKLNEVDLEMIRQYHQWDNCGTPEYEGYSCSGYIY